MSNVIKLQGFKFFRDQNNNVYIDCTDGRLRTYEAGSPDIENLIELANRNDRFIKIYSQKELDEVIRHNVLYAKLNGKVRVVGKRYLRIKNEIIVNQVDRVLKINKDSICEVDLKRKKYRFVESTERLPLPKISKEATVEDFLLLKKFLHLSDEDDWLIVVVLMVYLILGYSEFPILGIFGDAESGKTWISSRLQKFLDPSTFGVVAQINDREHLASTIASSYIVFTDNADSLTRKMQDSLCMTSTGGTFTRTKKYKDKEVLALNLSAPIVMNGIVNPVTRDDLLSRMVLLKIQPLVKKRSRTGMAAKFDENFVQMYSGFLRLVQESIIELPNVKYTKSEYRMVDFCKVGIAVERVLGFEKRAFLKAYSRNQERGLYELLEESEITSPLLQLISGGDIEMTYGRLLKELDLDSIKSPKSLSQALSKLRKAFLNIHSIQIEERGHTRSGNMVGIFRRR